MKLVAMLMILIIPAALFAQQQQTQPSKYDPEKPSVIFFLDGNDEKQVEYIKTVTVGFRELVNLVLLDVNKPDGAKRLQVVARGYDMKGVDLVCVIGTDEDSTVLLGSEDIAKYIQGMFQHYSRPDIFKKPEITYEKMPTIDDRFDELMDKIDRQFYYFAIGLIIGILVGIISTKIKKR